MKKLSRAKNGVQLKVAFNIINTNLTRLTLNTSEGYELFINASSHNVYVNIVSNNFFGVRHGLETLLQLIVCSLSINSIKIISGAYIKDKPLYPYRGVMLDTARHFISIRSIKRTIEGMAMSKLNTFHWHITDSESFPYGSTTIPELSTLGAYSPLKIYTPSDISNVITYALIRGVRVIPELDSPAHIREGLENLKITVDCNDQHSQLNPILEKTYEVLEVIYKDIIEDFNPELFHMGTDEVSLSCWMQDESIKNWMKNRNWDLIEANGARLLNYFQNKALERYRKHQKIDTPIIIWDGILSQDEYLQNIPQSRYIIQVWNGGNGYEKDLIEKGYNIIISSINPFYLDCGFDIHCQNYNTWENIYDFRIFNELNINDEVRYKILGSEVTVWTEKIDDSYLDSRIWPRAAAMAEIFWSEPDETSSKVKQRFLYHRERLVQIGIGAEAIDTEWCIQNGRECSNLIRLSKINTIFLIHFLSSSCLLLHRNSFPKISVATRYTG
nr:chitooligosaccharidolytic beta-N-acetylglucosaminidase-like isoform X1 [Onthophagus taurus]